MTAVCNMSKKKGKCISISCFSIEAFTLTFVMIETRLHTTFLYERDLPQHHSKFSRTHTFGNIAIIVNFVLQYICWLLHYMNCMMSVNVKIDASENKRITYWDCRFHWSSSFWMAQLKWSWQYWHSCIVKSLWKPLFCGSRDSPS